jgi:hypothetical protein
MKFIGLIVGTPKALQWLALAGLWLAFTGINSNKGENGH